MKTYKSIIIIAILSLFFLAGCSAQPAENLEGGFITGATLNESTAGELEYFQIPVSQDPSQIGLDAWASLTQGSLSVRVRNLETGELVYEAPLSGSNSKVNTSISLPAGQYSLRMGWDEPVNATFSLEWHPGAVELPQITPVVLVSGIGMLFFGLLFLFFGARSGGWKYAWLGAGFWAGTVIIKFAIAALLNGLLYQGVTAILPGLPGTLLFSLYIGCLTGVTEILITWLILRKTAMGRATRTKVFSFSLGFGAFEAILLGALNLASMVSVLATQDQLPAASLRTVAASNNLLYTIAPILERIFTIGVHLGCNVLLFYAVYKNQSRWFWYSFALKSGIDAVAGYAQLNGDLTSMSFLWTIELFVILFGLIGFWVSRKILPRLPEKPAEPIPTPVV